MLECLSGFILAFSEGHKNTFTINTHTCLCVRNQTAGLQSGEISRIRQYERFIGESMEHLRMVKMYRSPQALRSFARIFTLLLPPFYAPTFAQLAYDLDSLTMGILFAIVTSVGLTALFESIQVLEDPFVAFLTLDGIGEFSSFSLHGSAGRNIFPFYRAPVPLTFHLCSFAQTYGKNLRCYTGSS